MCCASEYRFLRFLPSTSLLIITIQVIITLIQFRETQRVAPLLTHSMSAFVLVRILFHIFPASRVTFEAFHRIKWPKMDSTKFPTTYEIISPGHLHVCVCSSSDNLYVYGKAKEACDHRYMVGVQ